MHELDKEVLKKGAIALPPDDAQSASTLGPMVVQVEAANNSSRHLVINVLAGGGVNAVKIALQLVMLPLMARLLGPTEFGVYALAQPTVAFFITLADGGLGTSLATEKTQSQRIWSTAFWFVLAIGIVLMLSTAAWGVILAQLSHEPRVTAVMALLSLSFLFVTLSVVPIARLTRERRLAVISGADLVANLIGAVVAVSLALSGAGVISLAAQYVTLFIVRAVILNLVAFVRPALTFQLSAIRSHVMTGSSIIGSRLADFSGRLVENLIIGRSFGPASLGTFTFANQVPRFVTEAAAGPIWGALYAHGLREDDTSLTPLYLQLVYFLTLVLAPVAALASATVPGLVPVVLGSGWDQAGLMLSILIPFYVLNAITMQSSAIILARGFGWPLFGLALFVAVARAAVVLLSPWIGLVGATWGIGLVYVANSVMVFSLHCRKVPVLRSLQFRRILIPVGASVVGGLACYSIVRGGPTEIGLNILGLAAGLAGYLTIVIVFAGKQLWGDIIALRHLVRR